MTTLNIKNIPAFIRPGAFTLQVSLPADRDPNAYSGQYTYVSDDASIAIGDEVLVVAANAVKLGRVVGRDADVDIDPMNPLEIRWVIAKVDVEPHRTRARENAALIDEYQKSLARSKRNSVAEALRASLDADGAQAVNKILGGSAPARKRAAPARKRTKSLK